MLRAIHTSTCRFSFYLIFFILCGDEARLILLLECSVLIWFCFDQFALTRLEQDRSHTPDLKYTQNQFWSSQQQNFSKVDPGKLSPCISNRICRKYKWNTRLIIEWPKKKEWPSMESCSSVLGRHVWKDEKMPYGQHSILLSFFVVM